MGSAYPSLRKLINVNIIDPVGDRAIEKASVSLTHGRVLAIRENTDSSLIGPRGSDGDGNGNGDDEQVVDLKGLFLCPSLIGAHVHVVRGMLAWGFTTVRGCGGADAALKQAIDEWLIIGPRLNIAGHAFAGHQCCAGQKPGISRLCDGEAECMVAVRDEMRKGGNFTKIMAGGGVSSRLNNLAHAQFLPGEISAIAQTAASFDTYVTAHAYSNRAMRHAAENGARGIEHGNLLDEETAIYLASKDAFFTPTLATYHALMKSPFNKWITGDLMRRNVRVMESGLHLVASMQPFRNNEFSIRAQIQSSLDVLYSATINPARMMEMENDVGRVAEGIFADLLVLKSNPFVSVRVLDEPVNMLAVIKEGRVTFSQCRSFL
ncbi:uncharacterized protein BDV17DRAFT_301267 [Aspergillus undulatus]|uniref:uncharacterized protein n=1 Tax=Aspergillus undulatus TaxID=1810928 RepID=UPI003CCE0381